MNNKSGFTLLEMLIIIIIVSVLAIIGKGSYDYSVEKSIVSEVAPMITAISFAQQAYYVEHHHFAAGIEELNLDVEGNLEYSDALYFGDPQQGARYYLRTKNFIYGTWCLNGNLQYDPYIAFTRIGNRRSFPHHTYYDIVLRLGRRDHEIHYQGVGWNQANYYDNYLKKKVLVYLMKKILPSKDYESIILK